MKYIISFLFFFIGIHLAGQSIPRKADILKDLEICNSKNCLLIVEYCMLLKIKEAVPILKKKLQTAEKEKKYSLKSEIIYALGELGNPSAIPLLLKHLPMNKAVSALNLIDPNWRKRKESKELYDHYLKTCFGNNQDESDDKYRNFMTLLIMEKNIQKIKQLCIEVLKRKDKELIYLAADKLVELKAVEAVDPIMDFIIGTYDDTYTACFEALNSISPGWQKLPKAMEINHRLLKEFNKAKLELDRRIVDPQYLESYKKEKERVKNSKNKRFDAYEDFKYLKGAGEINNILYILEKMKSPYFLSLFLKILQDEKEMVYLRCQAVEMIGRIIDVHDREAFLVLLETLSHEISEIRLSAVKALNYMGERFYDRLSKLPELMTIEKELINMLYEKNEHSFQEIVKALHIWGSSQIVPYLLDILDKQYYADSYDIISILRLLVRFKDPRVFNILVDLYKKASEDVKPFYIKLMGDLECKKAIPLIKRALIDENRLTRAYAEWALFKINKYE